MKHARGPRLDDDDTITTPLRTGPERVRHGSPGPRHVQTRGVEEGRGPEGLIAAALERWLAGRLVERSGGRRTRALRCAPRADYCRRAALRDVARRTRAGLRSRDAGQGRPRGRPQPAARGRGSQQPRHAAGPPAGYAAGTRWSSPRSRGLGTAPQGRRLTAVWLRTPAPPHGVLFETRHRATNEAPCAAPHGQGKESEGQRAPYLRTTWGRQRHVRGNRGPRPRLHVVRMGGRAFTLPCVTAQNGTSPPRGFDSIGTDTRPAPARAALAGAGRADNHGVRSARRSVPKVCKVQV